VISSQRLLVRSKQAIAYVGIACATALMRISLPALDRNFYFHPLILLKILSFK
jgi:hypothetical protein